MDDQKFNEMLKVTIVSCIVISVLIIIACIYIFNSRKAELSIYADTGFTNKLESIGIKEEEFKQYLSVFSLLVNEDYSEGEHTQNLDDVHALNVAVCFAKEIYGYEIVENAEGLQIYDTNMINDVIKEIKGMYIEKNLNAEPIYSYNEADNTYVNNTNEYKSANIEIEDINKEGEKIIVQYKCMFSNEEELQNEQSESAERKIYTIKATVLQNTDYKYSKYFVSSIEKI